MLSHRSGFVVFVLPSRDIHGSLVRTFRDEDEKKMSLLFALLCRDSPDRFKMNGMINIRLAPCQMTIYIFFLITVLYLYTVGDYNRGNAIYKRYFFMC